LPMLVRGLYYDQWQPSRVPLKWRTEDEFIGHVSEGLKDIRPVNQTEAVQAVCNVLARHITMGEFDELASVLPAKIRSFFDQAASAPAHTPHVQRPH
jgi:uncharacterized protein (DUF2267 family)